MLSFVATFKVYGILTKALTQEATCLSGRSTPADPRHSSTVTHLWLQLTPASVDGFFSSQPIDDLGIV